MKNMFIISLLSLGLLACVTPQNSNLTSGYTTLSGKPLKISHFISVNPDCSSKGYTVLRVITPPENGKISFVQSVDFTSPRLRPGTDFSHCNNKRIAGTSLIYTPNAGFIGDDKTTIERINPSGLASTFNLKLNSK